MENNERKITPIRNFSEKNDPLGPDELAVNGEMPVEEAAESPLALRSMDNLRTIEERLEHARHVVDGKIIPLEKPEE